MSSWKQMASIEHLDGLNGLDVGSPKFKEYVKIINELASSRDPKKLKEAEYSLYPLGIKLGVAITLNPSPVPPNPPEVKYANERGLKIDKCEDGRYRWFKKVA
jgi:hypothetical protein